MKKVIYKGQDGLLGYHGHVKHGQVLEVSEAERNFMVNGSPEQFADATESESVAPAAESAQEAETPAETPAEATDSEQPARRTRKRSE